MDVAKEEPQPAKPEDRVCDWPAVDDWAFVRQILRHFPNGSVSVFDRDLRYVLAEGTGLARAGLSPAMLVGKTPADLFPPGIVEFLTPFYRRALAGEPVSFELSYDGRVYAVDAAPLYAPGRSDAGAAVARPAAPEAEGDGDQGDGAPRDRTDGQERPDFMLLVARDITDRKRTEEDMRASQETLGTAFDYAPTGIALLGLDGYFLRANPAFCAFTGYSEEELRETAFQSLAHPEDLPADLDLLGRLDSGELGAYRIERRYIRKGGEVAWALLSVSLVRDAAGNPLHYIRQAQDITERKRAEEALLNSEAKFRSLVSGNIIGILQADLEHIVEANDAFLQMVGYTRQDLVARSIKWREMTPPEWAPADEQGLQEILEHGACVPYEKEYFHKDGHRLPVLIGATLLTRSPLTWMCFLLDLTERKRAEANERQARLQAEEAVLARDRLLSIVAHDLRNPLTAIHGTAQIIARRLQRNDALDRERLAALVQRLDGSAMRMNHLIDEILDFSKLQAGVPLVLSNPSTDLVALVQHAVEECRQAHHRNALVVTSAVPHLTAEWDPGRLERVFANLLDNAVKYSPEGAPIQVEIETERSSGSRGEDGQADAPGWVRVKVTDHGIGIPAADLPHIFEWYTRGSNAGSSTNGTGIGLAGARQTVEQYGGTITVASMEGQGSTFTVSLPLPAEI